MSSLKMMTTIIQERPVSTPSTPMNITMMAMMLREDINAILAETINSEISASVARDISAMKDFMVMVVWKDAITIEEREESMIDAVTLTNTLLMVNTTMITIGGCQCQFIEE